MVAVAQLVESRIVIPVVVGSSPISHPKPERASVSLALFLWFRRIITRTRLDQDRVYQTLALETTNYICA